jgi:hypothetical protein
MNPLVMPSRVALHSDNYGRVVGVAEVICQPHSMLNPPQFSDPLVQNSRYKDGTTKNLCHRVLSRSLQGITERPLPCNYNVIQPDSAPSRRCHGRTGSVRGICTARLQPVGRVNARQTIHSPVVGRSSSCRPHCRAGLGPSRFSTTSPAEATETSPILG